MAYYRLRLGSGTRTVKAKDKADAANQVLGEGNWKWDRDGVVRPGAPGHSAYYEVKRIPEYLVSDDIKAEVEGKQEKPKEVSMLDLLFDESEQWAKDNPGEIEFTCEFCGPYNASRAMCNKCEH